MLSLAALTAAAQLDDDAPSGYVASYSEGEHTVQSELFYLPPAHSVEKRLREMASEVDRRWARAVDWIGPGWIAKGPGSSRQTRVFDHQARARVQPRVALVRCAQSPGGTACHLLRAAPCGCGVSRLSSAPRRTHSPPDMISLRLKSVS